MQKPNHSSASQDLALTTPANAPLVVHVVESFAAGCLVALATLCRNTPDFRHVIIHSIRAETPQDFRGFFPENVAFHQLAMTRSIRNPLADLKSFFHLRRLLSQLGPDVVHCHSSKAGFIGRFASWSLGLPSVYTPHGYAFLSLNMNRFQRSIFRLAEWLATRVGNAVGACGREEYDQARKLGGKDKLVCLIPNGLDPQDLAQLMDAGDTWAAATKDDVCISAGTCGRISAERDPCLFSEVTAKAQGNLSWTWIGAEKGDPRLPPVVNATGWLNHDEALNRMARLDIYIQPSRLEGLSYAILEAMALGKPVVVSDIPANRALVKHGVTGFLGADGQEMADHVSRLASDPALRRRMGQAARDYVLRRHNASLNCRIYSRLYVRLAGRPGLVSRAQ